ncbi:MAG: hypothetical protein KAT11_02485 [Phycisphaerae bacterium]|nr:hypothetical protein [Phycisphaerae bacterium]
MPQPSKTLIHVTHEAARKVGGIGTVLEGMLTSGPYRQAVSRSILVAPLFTTEDGIGERLGPDGDVLYSSIDGLTKNQYAASLAKVEQEYRVNIVYGRRTLRCPWSRLKTSVEVLLIDVGRPNKQKLNHFKGLLYEKFAIRSDRYEQFWDFEQYVRLAQPALEAVRALGASRPNTDCLVIAHEFMGIPTALAAMLYPAGTFRTVFYAHETAPVRKIVEDYPGHDTMFYNVLAHARDHQHYLHEIFPQICDFFKYPLVKASKWCDNILAVGDYVAQELHFLSPEFDAVDIDVVYNGLPAWKISLKEKLASKKKLQDYAQTLLGHRPDYIFTHVTRMVTSKGLWRDLRVMKNLEPELLKKGQTALLFVLSCELPYRDPQDIYNMEQWWHWPVVHREGLGDLTAGEALFYSGVQEINAQSRAVKVVFVNQFGWDRATCGRRMPKNMSFVDLRRGSDLEFGQSTYEPFGISQLEPLSFGTLCVVSNVCGCVGFVRATNGKTPVPNVIIADYTDLGPGQPDLPDILAIDRAKREVIEEGIAAGVAQEILKRLPASQDELAKLIQSGYELAKKMSWEEVVSRYVLPALDRACRRDQALASA